MDWLGSFTHCVIHWQVCAQAGMSQLSGRKRWQPW